jgi:excisionase family DNA binding protein
MEQEERFSGIGELLNSGSKTFSLDEIASAMKITTETARLWAKGGKLPSVRVGSTIRVEPDDLVYFINSAATGYHWKYVWVNPGMPDNGIETWEWVKVRDAK